MLAGASLNACSLPAAVTTISSKWAVVFSSARVANGKIESIVRVNLESLYGWLIRYPYND